MNFMNVFYHYRQGGNTKSGAFCILSTGMYQNVSVSEKLTSGLCEAVHEAVHVREIELNQDMSDYSPC